MTRMKRHSKRYNHNTECKIINFWCILWSRGEFYAPRILCHPNLVLVDSPQKRSGITQIAEFSIC
jgi:hypothetical protein